MHLPLHVASLPLSTASSGPLHAMSFTPRQPLPDTELAGIQKVLHEVLQVSRVSLQQLERLEAKRHRVYLVHLSDGSRLVLKCPPPHLIRLMRNEQRSLETEHQILQLLSSKPEVPVPRLVKADQSSGILGTPFILRDQIPGTPLAHIKSHLCASEHAAIDRTLGSHIRTISTLTSPKFGSQCQVQAGRGSASWREAFLQLLETVLRDGEDMLVSMPYDTVRHAVGGQQHALAAVSQARLVLLDAGRPCNVLVDERTRHVSGLLGAGSAVWGDPLLATCFADASDAFLEGYYGGAPGRVGGDGGGEERVRLLLYDVYRAVVAIVTQHYRPQQESPEMEARRDLTRALNRLTSL